MTSPPDAPARRRMFVEGRSSAPGARHRALITVEASSEAEALRSAQARSDRFQYGYDTFRLVADEEADRWDPLTVERLVSDG